MNGTKSDGTRVTKPAEPPKPTANALFLICLDDQGRKVVKIIPDVVMVADACSYVAGDSAARIAAMSQVELLGRQRAANLQVVLHEPTLSEDEGGSDRNHAHGD